MDSEKLFFNFLQLPNPQINAIEWSCSLLHDIAILPLCFCGWPPSESQCLETFTLKPSGDVIQFVLIMEVWFVFFLKNILSESFTGTQCSHLQGLGTPRPWTSHWTSIGWATFYIVTFLDLFLGCRKQCYPAGFDPAETLTSRGCVRGVGTFLFGDGQKRGLAARLVCLG